MNIEKFKKIGVIGFKKTGIALCRLLLSLRKKVKVSEKESEKNFSSSLVENFKKEGVKFEFGGHSENFLRDCDLVVISPGVDLKKSLIGKIIHQLSLPCVGEIELASWFTRSRIIAITGTNGKTTLSFLTFLLLKKKFPSVYLGGNIGAPFSSFVKKTHPQDLVVLEVSSFQLESILKFRPYVSCIINLELDHLDRYSNFEEYKEAKERIFMNQKKEDFAVINRNIFCCKEWERKIKAKILYFGDNDENENISCLKTIASIFNIESFYIKETISCFKGLPHRMQKIAQIKEVLFINDSKATNPSATLWALKNIKKPVILIAGGKDKGLDYTSILPFLGKVKKINLIGEAKEKIKASLKNHFKNIQLFSDLKNAVEDAFLSASCGDVVLFSPMCSSFDMFSNYIERGNYFIRIVNELKDKFK